MEEAGTTEAQFRGWESGRCVQPPLERGVESGEGLTELFPFLVSALEGPPTTREKVRVSMCLCKRNGIGAEQESTREGFLEEVANVPFPHLCLSSFRSECPSQRYVSLQCSRKKMLFLLTVACGGGNPGQRGGAALGAMAGPGSTRKRGLASRPASRPGFPEGPWTVPAQPSLSLTSAQRLRSHQRSTSGLWTLGSGRGRGLESRAGR